MLGPRAVLHEDVTVSAAQLRCGNVIVLQRVVIDALVETGAHIPAGVHISQAVPPLACDAPAKKTDLQCEEDNGCADHERRPLLPWLLAVFTRGVGAALCDAALLGFTLATYLCLGLPSSGNHLAILEELVLVTPSWKILLFSMVVLAITVILRPLMFTAWLVGVRRAFIRPVADGDRASHSAGSIFLELALRSEEVRMIDGMCGLLHRTWVARVFGLRVAARGFLPLPKLDRPELVSVGEGSYIGGGNTLCTRQVDASGASYQQICIGCDSFLANGTVLMPGASFGPRAVLGNRSLGIAGEEYNDAVFMGQKGESESAGGGAGLVTMGGNRRQSDQTRVSAVRLMTMRGGQHLAPGELPEEPSSIRPHEVPREGWFFSPVFLAWLCIALFQGVDALILFALLLLQRQQGLSIAGPLVFSLLCAPGLRLLWYLGATRICKFSLVGSFREGKPAKLGSRAAVGRNIFTFLISLLDDASEPFKGSAIYNAMQRALGAKVGPGVCWLGRKHVKSALGPHCYELMSHLVDWPSVSMSSFTHRQLVP